MRPIPFNRAAVTGNETAYVSRVIAEGPLHGDGPFTRQCHEWLERLTGAPKALLTTSCTHALEMAALLLDLREGDEVRISFNLPNVHLFDSASGERIALA